MFLSFFSIDQLLNELLYILNNNLEVEKLTFNDFKLLKYKLNFFRFCLWSAKTRASAGATI
jgi:hypothetical protein